MACVDSGTVGTQAAGTGWGFQFPTGAAEEARLGQASHKGTNFHWWQGEKDFCLIVLLG